MVVSGDMSGLIKVWKVESKEEIWSFEVGDLEVSLKRVAGALLGLHVCRPRLKRLSRTAVAGVAPLRPGTAGRHGGWERLDVEDPKRRVQDVSRAQLPGNQREDPS